MSTLGEITALAIDDEFVYWGTGMGSGHAGKADIGRVPKAGGPSVVLWSGGNWPPIRAIELDESSVYFATQTAIRRIPKTGGAETVLAEQQTEVWPMALDQNTVFWASNGRDREHTAFINSVPKQGGKVARLASQIPNVTAIAVDAMNLYWGTMDDPGRPDAVWTVPNQGGTPRILVAESEANDAASYRQSLWLFADDSAVYWLHGSNGLRGRGWVELWRIEK